MKMCYNVQTCAEGSSLENDVILCEKVGYHYMEINYAKTDEYLKDHTLEQLGNLLKDHGIAAASVNAIFGTQFCTEENFNRVKDQYLHACEIGQATGAPCTIVLSGEWSDVPQGATRADIEKDSIETLHRLADVGVPYGMKIAYEPVGTMTVGSIQYSWDVVRKVDRPEVGLAPDIFNLFLFDLLRDVDDLRQIDKDKIFIVHIDDAEDLPFAEVNQMHRVFPGTGRANCIGFMEAIKSTGYDGPVSMEVLNPTIWAKGAEIVIPEAYERGKWLLSEIGAFEE